MIAIAHFAMGVIGGLILLIWFPQFVSKYFGNLIQNDLFFVLGSGFFAMLPDLNKYIKSAILDKFHASPLANICWGHHYMDTFPDTIQPAVIVILIAVIIVFIYFKKIKG